MKNTQQRLLRALWQQIRENFDEEQAFLDIEAQLSGVVVKDESKEEDSSLQEDMHPLQLVLLQRLLSYPASNSVEDEWKQNDDAVDVVTQYCDILEDGPLQGRPKQIRLKSTSSTDPDTGCNDSSNIRDSPNKRTETTLSPRDK